MAAAAWYHRDISRVHAEDLLARAGRDGSFLLRDSESVPGAYALCLLFQRHVHTYRILPDVDGLLAVQTTQGVQVNCFRTLEDLVLGYQQPHKGLVAPLLFPVPRDSDAGDESSDDEKTTSLPVSLNAAPATSSQSKPSCHALFLDKLQELNTSSVADDVIALLNNYLVTELPLDIENVHRGATSLCHLKGTLGTACQGLNSEIDLTLASLETLAKVFDHPSASATPSKTQGQEMEIDSVLFKISSLVSLLSSLEKKVVKALQDAVTNHNLAAAPPPATQHKVHAPAAPLYSFQVKTLRCGRQTLSLDVDAGVLLLDRKSHSSGAERISHDRILQVVKFQSCPSKLRLVIDSHHCPPREMTFESRRKCEAFCRLVLVTRSRHSQPGDPDLISVFVGTWNMGGSPPPRGLPSWLTCRGLGHTPDDSVALLPYDVYALGTQENPQGEKEWTENIRATLRSFTHVDFKQVAVQSLWNMKLAVFVKPEHEGRVTNINTSCVKTGLGKALGNKGAVGVSFLFNGSSFGFINCHLSSGSDKVLRRNHNFVDILRLLSLGDKHLSCFDVSLRFQHLFWCGDLNYRLDLDVQDILKHVSRREFQELLCSDQLTRERLKRKTFLNFKEEKISFPPTYRYERGSRDCYLWQKYKTSGVRVNVPSWCDRILWRSYPDTHLLCTSYGCTDDVFTSDHSPVFATFQVGVTAKSSVRSDAGSGVERAWIELEGMEAIVKTSSKEKFLIEFHSPCLEETRRSFENDSQSCDVPGFLKLAWSLKQLPKLFPVKSDMDFLQDQHLLLSVKSCDGFESYGECCMALRSLTGGSEKFETLLSHRGEEIGSIRGRVRIHVPKDKRGTRKKIYDLFCFEKDTRVSAKTHVCPASTQQTQVSAHRCPAVVSKPTPSSYTNPAYYIFEGVSVVRQADEARPRRSETQVIWAGNEALQLPKVSGRLTRRHSRRSDFTEIEIPAVLPQYSLTNDVNASKANSSYQLFPTKNPVPIPAPSTKAVPAYQEQAPKPKYNKRSIDHDSILPEKNLRNLYMNHSVIIKDQDRRDHRQPPQDRINPPRKTRVPFSYVPTRIEQYRGSVPWVAEVPAPAPTGDHSLTALQIAKSLSEVDFFPSSRDTSLIAQHLPHFRKAPVMYSERRYSWEKDVLQGAPETIRELLSTLGLQKYTLGLSLNGWDDLDYFSGVTEDDLRAAGVINPSHRRRILDNLPRNWN